MLLGEDLRYPGRACVGRDKAAASVIWTPSVQYDYRPELFYRGCGGTA